MNAVLKNILERRTIKPDRFSGNTVDDALIEEMLLAAHWAPTHGNTEQWEFKVLLEKEDMCFLIF